MNSLYTSGVRQTNSLQADMEKLRNGDNSPALLDICVAFAMHRTIDDYDSMTKREIIKAKQEKAQMRVQKFRADYTELRTQFERLKEENTAAIHESNRAELISASAASAAPFTAQSFDPPSWPATARETISESPFRSSTPGIGGREFRALDEHTQGREVLDNLVDQRQMLKGTQRRLLNVANTLGLSRDVIGWIERRSTQDTYIFFAGAIFTFFCFYLIWKYLG
ncbi:golgi SNAP receptor complex member bos1 [Pholiota molesta]|nr:golgi SNAP receptor complex member bos1 [Pholiota molesta]